MKSNRVPTLTPAQHRARAQRYREQASQYVESKAKRELLQAANKHEAIAAELIKLEERPVLLAPQSPTGEGSRHRPS
jgi:hypothetical protein